MLSRERLGELTSGYRDLRIALVGDFCLDRYLEIDPAKSEVSIETGLPVHNVVRVCAQPGGAGTILCNLAALGVGEIIPIGFCGEDGEGYELRRAMEGVVGTAADSLLTTPLRRTFTYCKPLVVAEGQPPEELNRLDSKNWTPTPLEVTDEMARRLREVIDRVDAVILLDQVDLPETGVVTSALLDVVAQLARERPQLLFLADSRQRLAEFPPLSLKMNGAELARLIEKATGEPPVATMDVQKPAGDLARRNRRHVFVTLAERGIVGADAEGQTAHAAALPVRGPIDIVGAGDCVTANLAAALAAGATLAEALHISMAAASVVVHKLGTTGTASVAQIVGVSQSSE